MQTENEYRQPWDELAKLLRVSLELDSLREPFSILS